MGLKSKGVSRKARSLHLRNRGHKQSTSRKTGQDFVLKIKTGLSTFFATFARFARNILAVFGYFHY
jgi:hypothetical protein